MPVIRKSDIAMKSRRDRKNYNLFLNQRKRKIINLLTIKQTNGMLFVDAHWIFTLTKNEIREIL